MIEYKKGRYIVTIEIPESEVVSARIQAGPRQLSSQEACIEIATERLGEMSKFKPGGYVPESLAPDR